MSEIYGNLTKIVLLQQQTTLMMTMQFYKAYQDFISYNMPYTNLCNVSKKNDSKVS